MLLICVQLLWKKEIGLKWEHLYYFYWSTSLWQLESTLVRTKNGDSYYFINQPIGTLRACASQPCPALWAATATNVSASVTCKTDGVALVLLIGDRRDHQESRSRGRCSSLSGWERKGLLLPGEPLRFLKEGKCAFCSATGLGTQCNLTVMRPLG